MSENNNEIPSSQLKLLHLLADGVEHSGQELADILGVSRTTIWKHLSKLNSLGVELVSRPGHGYCIEGGINFLSTQKITSCLSDVNAAHLGQLILLHSVDSTNSFLLRRAPTEKISVCMAELQTAGRGRRGREWVSPFAKNIYLSLKMTSENGISSFEGLSLAVGVVIARALQMLGIVELQLKWPNDLLWRNQKLGGVLIEVSGDPSGRCHIIIGVGLNVTAEKSMHEAIGQPWVNLHSIADTLSISLPDRNAIVSSLLNELLPLLVDFQQKNFLFYKDEWQVLNAHHGQCVDIHIGEKIISGIVVGVSDTGALILKTQDDGEMIFHGGEVSLRRSANDI